MSNDGVYSVVEQVMTAKGVPLSIWGPIMDIESQGNSSAVLSNSNEDSIGLFALNRSGGLGSGYTVAQLQDPLTNATIAASAMGPNYSKGVANGLSGLDLLRYVAYNSGFPTTQGVGALSSDQVVKNYDVKLVNEYSNGEGGGMGGGAAISPSLSSSLGSLFSGLGISSMTQKQKMSIMGVAALVLVVAVISE